MVGLYTLKKKQLYFVMCAFENFSTTCTQQQYYDMVSTCTLAICFLRHWDGIPSIAIAEDTPIQKMSELASSQVPPSFSLLAVQYGNKELGRAWEGGYELLVKLP